jgi:hypothetical protein
MANGLAINEIDSMRYGNELPYHRTKYIWIQERFTELSNFSILYLRKEDLKKLNK